MRMHDGARFWPSELRTFFALLKNLFLGCYARLIRVKVSGREIFQKLHTNCIVVANHVTGADSFVLQIALRRRLFMLAARRWFRSRFLEFVMTFFCDMLPVALDEGMKNLKGVKRALALLKHKQSVGLYPSAGMSRDGLLHEIHNGAAYLAYRSGVPIVPVYMRNLALGPERMRLDHLGDDAREGIGSLLYNLFNRKIEIHIAAPIYPHITARNRRQEIDRLNAEIASSFHELNLA